MSHQARRFISMTRGSSRNSRRYRRKAAESGASGVPRLARRMPTAGISVCWKSG